MARAATNLRRIVAIEFGTWRSGRNGGSRADGLLTHRGAPVLREVVDPLILKTGRAPEHNVGDLMGYIMTDGPGG